jgi:phospholipase C
VGKTPAESAANGREEEAMGRTRNGPAEGNPAHLENLQKIEHIVVLMLENRSFDHMLGYLTLEGGRTDVDGLKPTMKNDHAGKTFPVHKLENTALDKPHDPCHSPDCIDQQLSHNSGGFVDNFAKTHPNVPDPEVVMGYYDAETLPVYDHLAEQFLICDRWFSSLAGDTWPNRLYAVTGGSEGHRKHFADPPLYDLKSFVRHLDHMQVRWKWYFHDVPTISAADSEYRPPKAGFDTLRRLAFFDRRLPLAPSTFVEDAAKKNGLPGVSWIDPNFADVRLGPAGSNDDHPPSDVTAAQDLVVKLYNAVVHSPDWKKILLVITYDEHGGFFDHVQPGPAKDDFPACAHYGVRVPAIVVSPWVKAGAVSRTVFDHTSIIKTILLRFCRQPNGAIPDMGRRVAAATHLGELLSLPAARAPTPAGDIQALVDHVANWRKELFVARMELQATGLVPEPTEPSDLEQQATELKKALIDLGMTQLAY